MFSNRNRFNLYVNVAFWIAVIIIVLVPLIYLVCFKYIDKQVFTIDTTTWGQFGDYMGGVLNPILTFFAFIMIIIELKSANEKADNQRREDKVFHFIDNINYIALSVNTDLVDLNKKITEDISNNYESVLGIVDIDQKWNHYFNELIKQYEKIIPLAECFNDTVLYIKNNCKKDPDSFIRRLRNKNFYRSSLLVYLIYLYCNKQEENIVNILKKNEFFINTYSIYRDHQGVMHIFKELFHRNN